MPATALVPTRRATVAVPPVVSSVPPVPLSRSTSTACVARGTRVAGETTGARVAVSAATVCLPLAAWARIARCSAAIRLVAACRARVARASVVVWLVASRRARVAGSVPMHTTALIPPWCAGVAAPSVVWVEPSARGAAARSGACVGRQPRRASSAIVLARVRVVPPCRARVARTSAVVWVVLS